jgi:hypothetical protein
MRILFALVHATGDGAAGALIRLDDFDPGQVEVGKPAQ